MPPKFGNYLFRNLKGQGDAAATDSPNIEGAAELADQTIVLRPEDFTDCGTGSLVWPILDPPEIRVQFRDTQGLMEGRVVIAAGVLRRNYPSLVPAAVKDEVLFPLSLKTVVLQLQNCLRGEGSAASAAAPSTDFDTPIAQVAREDEGFLKLERGTRNDLSRTDTPDQAQASEGVSPFPLIREKPSTSPPNPPAIQVTRPLPPTAVLPSTETRTDPFKDLPKVGPHRGDRHTDLRSRDFEMDPDPAAKSAPPAISAELASQPAAKPIRRLALERLQEIFLTDDFLDAHQVAKLLRALPKVKGALILLEDGTVMGGNLPEGFHLDAAFAAPGLLRASREFVGALNGSNVAAVTLLADVPISVFLEHKVCILIAHEGRGLLPGMRERISDIAKALDAMYEPGTEWT
jgi:hypothetical protein